MDWAVWSGRRRAWSDVEWTGEPDSSGGVAEQEFKEAVLQMLPYSRLAQALVEIDAGGEED